MSEQRQLSVDFRVPTQLPGELPVLALRQGVLLPGAVQPFTVGRPASIGAVEAAQKAVAGKGLVIIALQREPTAETSPDQLLSVGVLGRIVDSGRPSGRPPFVVVQGLCRVSLLDVRHQGDHLRATYRTDESVWPTTVTAQALLSSLRDSLSALPDLVGGPERLSGLLSAPFPPLLWIDAVGAAVESEPDWKKELLLTSDPLARADRLLRFLATARELLSARRAVQERVQSEVQSHNREAVLRAQLKAIQEELGEGDEQNNDLRERLASKHLPEEVRKAVERELTRLARLREGSPERSVATDWLEWVADLPWPDPHQAAQGDGALALRALESSLDQSHFGLDDVKKQVVEHLAVRLLAGSGRADVLLLVGPPGVGKTSIGQAIADATGRKLVRVALGGVRDEAELRGHRRTYIGARPGRLIEGIRRAGQADPVVLLDEIDKLGRGWQGDPAAALLEILDPEQNHAFTDHYLELPFDLSRVLFVATANDLSQVPAPLMDRMEVIRLEGYSQEEKLRIVREHLLSRLARNAGVSSEDVQFTDAALREAIAGWTREAGVRNLQRTLGKVYRAAAVARAKGELQGPLVVDVGDLRRHLGRRRFEDEPRLNEGQVQRPGIVNGLAWTPSGGDVLHVEAASLPGRGQLVLTGQLGDVMKESARAALTYVLSQAEALGIPRSAHQDRDIHIHVPAGAVPKDGPSAGVTMFTALASLYTGRPVRPEVAMTGEATLRGRVLPVGGIKSKVLAAHRQGLTTIILPRRNAPDLEDLPEAVRRELDIVLVDHMDEVLAAALRPAPELEAA